MKVTPFQLYLRSLLLGAEQPGLRTKVDALDRLRRMNNEDLGYDVERWREWGRQHPEVSGIWPDDEHESDAER